MASRDLSPSTEKATPKSAAPDLGVAELLARVEAATGPDRELDARLYVTLIARLKMPLIDRMIAERAALRPNANVWLDGAHDWKVKHYTASLDAALALVERALPERRPYLSNMGITGKEWNAELRFWRDRHAAWGRTAPLALLAAMLRALGNTHTVTRRAEPEGAAQGPTGDEMNPESSRSLDQ